MHVLGAKRLVAQPVPMSSGCGSDATGDVKTVALFENLRTDAADVDFTPIFYLGTNLCAKPMLAKMLLINQQNCFFLSSFDPNNCMLSYIGYESKSKAFST